MKTRWHIYFVRFNFRTLDVVAYKTDIDRIMGHCCKPSFTTHLLQQTIFLENMNLNISIYILYRKPATIETVRVYYSFLINILNTSFSLPQNSLSKQTVLMLTVYCHLLDNARISRHRYISHTTHFVHSLGINVMLTEYECKKML